MSLARADSPTNAAPSVAETWGGVRTILAVRLDNLGDVLVTSPALRAIKQSLPDARLTLLASPVGAQVGRLHPDVDDVIVYQAPWMDPWHKLPQDTEREQDMIATLKGQQFDAAIIFTSFRQSPLPAAYLAYLADIPLRLAASIDGPGSLLTTRHKHPERMLHEVERGLDLVGAVGMTTDNLDLALRVPDQARRSLAERLPLADLPRPLVVVHPGCSMPARTYPWEMFAASADLLAARLGATILLTGAADERPLTERIAAHMTQPSLSVAGQISFAEFAALIEAADLTITNNTGPMHIAAAVKTPVVALFALTNPPQQWGPWRVPHRQLYHDVACRLCYSRVCPTDHACLRRVTPEMVAEASVELLAATTPKGRSLADAAMAALARRGAAQEVA